MMLVTGATGLVGNNVVRQALEQGQLVRVLVRASSDPRPLAGLGVERVLGDVGEAESVRRACEGARWVVHCAAHVQLGRSRLDLHRAVNVEGTRHVAQAARAVGARMIHVSTTDALGIRTGEEPAHETTPLAEPVNCCYVISKREAEQVVLAEAARGLDAVIVNPGYMLGPWDWKPSSGRMLLEIARGHGWFAPQGCFSVCDVRDVAAGILAAIERGRTGQRYILGGVTMSYLDTWRLMAEVTGARRPRRVAPWWMLRLAGGAGDLCTRLTGREPDVNSGAIALARLCKDLTSRRAETELGYRIRPFRQSVEDAWHWFCDHGYAHGRS